LTRRLLDREKILNERQAEKAKQIEEQKMQRKQELDGIARRR
jgi:hypothetical protein